MSSDVALRRGRLASRLTVAGLVWSVGLLIAALLVPAYSGQTESSSDGLTLSTATLVEQNGIWVLIPVAVPTLASAIVWFGLRRKCSRGSRAGGTAAWVSVALLTAFSLLAILSIGVFVLPVAILLACSASLAPSAAIGEARAKRQGQS